MLGCEYLQSVYGLLSCLFVCQAFCSKEGAELVEITSEKENNFVVKLLTTKNGKLTYI